MVYVVVAAARGAVPACGTAHVQAARIQRVRAVVRLLVGQVPRYGVDVVPGGFQSSVSHCRFPSSADGPLSGTRSARNYADGAYGLPPGDHRYESPGGSTARWASAQTRTFL